MKGSQSAMDAGSLFKESIGFLNPPPRPRGGSYKDALLLQVGNFLGVIPLAWRVGEACELNVGVHRILLGFGYIIM